MKLCIPFSCGKCLTETIKTTRDLDKPFNKSSDRITNYEVELNEENIYECICSKGHKTIIILQEERFEILFDFAIMALLDGYTREAAIGIASSFEAFYEFYIKIMCMKYSISIDDFKKVWKLIHNQSERQLGAFFIMQLLNKEELIWEEEWVSFRNKIVHKGHIPKINEVIKYGDYVLNIIFSLLKNLKTEDDEHWGRATFIHLSKHNNKIPKNTKIATFSIPTVIDLRSYSNPKFGNKTFKEALDSIKNNPRHIRFYRKGL